MSVETPEHHNVEADSGEPAGNSTACYLAK